MGVSQVREREGRRKPNELVQVWECTAKVRGGDHKRNRSRSKKKGVTSSAKGQKLERRGSVKKYDNSGVFNTDLDPKCLSSSHTRDKEIHRGNQLLSFKREFGSLIFKWSVPKV